MLILLQRCPCDIREYSNTWPHLSRKGQHKENWNLKKDFKSQSLLFLFLPVNTFARLAITQRGGTKAWKAHQHSKAWITHVFIIDLFSLTKFSPDDFSQNPDERGFWEEALFLTTEGRKNHFPLVKRSIWGHLEVYLIWKCFWVYVLGSGRASESEEKATLKSESGISLLLKMALTKI